MNTPPPLLKKSCLATLLIGLSLSCFPAAAQVTDKTIPVGAVVVPINGTGGKKQYQLTLLGVTLLQPIAGGGTVASTTGSLLTSSFASWTNNQFNGANGRYFLEITSGTFTGQMTEIIATTPDTITTAETLPEIAAGTTFRIRRQRTLADVFGSPPTALQGGTASTADEVLVYGPDGNFITYYYKTSGLGGLGWRKSGDAATDRAQEPLWLTDGVLIRRKQASDSSLVIVGEVKPGLTSVPIEPGSNFIANLSPINGTLTLGNSGLYNPAQSLQSLSGGTASTADTVQIYRPVTSTYSTYYYKTSGLGGAGWRAVGDAASDASGVSISGNAAVIIQRKSGAAFRWQMPVVYPGH